MAAPLLPEPDRLDRLVTLLDAACAGGGWHQPHRLVSVEPDRTSGDDDEPGLAFGFRTLDDGRHPLDELLGFRAPGSWAGLGVVCFGWASPVSDAHLDVSRHTTSGPRPSQHPDRLRVRVTTVVDRAGDERATATLEDGTVVDEPGSGTVTDALRRSLGLATAPPPVGTAELFGALWLGDLATAGRPLSWPEAALRHPAMQVLAGRHPRPQPEELIGSGRSLHRTMTWEKLRQRAADGRVDLAIGMDRDVAAWMDDGMFARWVLGSVPPLPRLLADAAAVLPPDVVRRVRRALRAWNLDPPLAAPRVA
ncbi:MAG TPA: hypothetical protein VM933_07540 [Acidimicrobiales bacterium]|nr:hypothetical protein [Acidimicrobiales bacterium]